MAWLLLHFLLAVVAQSVIAVHPKTTGLGMGRSFMIVDESSSLPSEIETRYYTQTMDHFNYNPQSYATFRQKYLLNAKYWGGSNASDNSPIFVVMGGEANITLFAHPGFINDLASHFNALIVYIEHRYYGDSMPFGGDTFNNATTLDFLSSTQALADYAQLITHLKTNLSAQNSPVIAVGGSYAGMLASWFRLKYPHIVYGALASSAPILYFDDITPQNSYYSIVTKDYRTCTEMVMPMGCGENETMFQAMPFDLEKEKEDCEAVFTGVIPRPHWITTEFGGHDIKSVLRKFASNIIFSNGGRDPYSGGGVLQNISDSVVALFADKGAHCSDLGTPMATDPLWLVSLRNSEKEIIQGWLSQYNI